jgi:hypothetical protein
MEQYPLYATVYNGVDGYIGVSGFQYPEFTLEAWINLATLNRYHGICGRAVLPWSNTAFAFRVVPYSYLSFVTSADGSTVDDLLSSITLSANTWYHVVATFKRPTKTLYINGVVVATKTWDYNIYNSTANIIVGGYAYGSGLNYLMNGRIGLVRFYNRALSQSEIQHNMYNPLNPVRDGLVLWLPMVEGSGTTVKDYSGNNNNGTLYGGVSWMELSKFEIPAGAWL